MRTNTVARALNDLGLAAWFGVSLAAAVDQETSSRALGGRATASGATPWTALSLVAAAVHVLGGLLLLPGNKGRLLAQRGVASTATAKSAVKVAAVASTVCGGWLARRTASDGTTEPEAGGTDERVRRPLRLARWASAVLTGTAVVLNARLGEQQRPKAVLAGVVRRLAPERIPALLVAK